MLRSILAFAAAMLGSLRDLAPIVAVVGFFQVVVLGRPLPDLGGLLAGTAAIVAGLTCFLFGLRMALFPLGESLAQDFARKGSVAALLAFAFALGFGTTAAEPALIAMADEAAAAAADAGDIPATAEALERRALELRLTVALSVGTAIVIGVLRIIHGWPVHVMIMCGYAIVVLMTLFAPPGIVGIAYDSGGVTTSTITVPMVTALGVGLASSIRGRSPLLDGFGLIAFASLTPMIFVMAYGIVR